MGAPVCRSQTTVVSPVNPDYCFVGPFHQASFWLPEEIIGVRRVSSVVCQIIWQAVKLGVGVSKQYHLEPSSAYPVPIGTRVRKGAIGVPRPVALNELAGGLARNF